MMTLLYPLCKRWRKNIPKLYCRHTNVPTSGLSQVDLKIFNRCWFLRALAPLKTFLCDLNPLFYKISLTQFESLAGLWAGEAGPDQKGKKKLKSSFGPYCIQKECEIIWSLYQNFGPQHVPNARGYNVGMFFLDPIHDFW